MSDEETKLGIRPDERDPELLLYDFLKFLTSLAILVLGGVLSLASGDMRTQRDGLAIVIVMVALAGVFAATGADGVVRARIGRRPLSRWTRMSRGVSMGLLGAGTGFFLSMWTQGL